MKQLSLALALCLGAASAHAQGLDLNGSWNTTSGAVNGRGAGNITMQLAHRNNGVTLTYDGGTMVCSLSGLRCRGTWQGNSGSGWFSVTFAPSGDSFSGTWGYNRDRSAFGAFSGTR